MKTKLIVMMAAATLLLFGGCALAAETTDAKVELQELIKKIQAKLKDGNKTEKGLAENLKEFDALLARHSGENTDDVAQILLMKAMLYIQVLEDSERGLQLVLPGSKTWRGNNFSMARCGRTSWP